MYDEDLASSSAVANCYCTGLCDRERALVMFFQAADSVLDHHCLVESSKVSGIRSKIKKHGHDMIKNLARLHNYFVKYEQQVIQQSSEAENFLNSLYVRVLKNQRAIASLCNRLIETSDFMNVNFTKVALTVNNMLFFVEQIKECIDVNISRKRQQLMVDGQLSTSVGIWSTSRINIDCESVAPNFSIESYVARLTSHISNSGVIDVYQEFLCEVLEREHGCKFQDLFAFLVKISHENPDEKAFIPVFLDNGKLQAVNGLTGKRYVHDLPLSSTRPVDVDQELPSASGIDHQVASHASETREEAYTQDELCLSRLNVDQELPSTSGIGRQVASRASETREEAYSEDELCLSRPNIDQEFPDTLCESSDVHVSGDRSRYN
ncbi:MAG: hypothetical protein ACTJLM_01660 [Ehrlichia sp.]